MNDQFCNSSATRSRKDYKFVTALSRQLTWHRDLSWFGCVAAHSIHGNYDFRPLMSFRKKSLPIFT